MGNPSEWTVGKGALVGISLIAMVVAGTYIYRTICWSNCKTIEALRITLPRADWAVGHYRMVEAGFGGIETTSRGGACVVWKSTANQSCKQDSDCNFPDNMTEIKPSPHYPSGYGPVVRPEYAGAYAYCSPQKTCWIKTKFSDCRKSPPDLALNQDNETNPANLLLVRAGLYGFDKGPAQIQGRVVACLNGLFTPGPGVIPPCGGGPGESIHDWSRAQPITVPMGPVPPLSPPG